MPSVRAAPSPGKIEKVIDGDTLKLADEIDSNGKLYKGPTFGIRGMVAPALEAAAEEARLSPEGVRMISLVEAGEQVSADPDQLHRILVNLMRNAREAVEQQSGRTSPGSIQVSLFEDEGVSVVRLADNGPGVSERARERLFQPFAGSTRPGGAGLGLAIARELAQGHGGDLALAETGPQGSVFELRLPGAPPKLTPPKRRRPKSAEA